MFTNKKAKYYGDNKVLLDSACLSTDTKPTTGVANGSKCIEMDTGKTYMFNEEDSEWEELPSSGGGGGGSSDFSTAEVTFEATSGMYTLDIAYISNDELWNVPQFGVSASDGPVTITVPLYKGKCFIDTTCFNGISPPATVTGDLELVFDALIITGDGTFTAVGA